MTIKENLEFKLQTKKFFFTEDEIVWMLQNVGHEQAKIRDQLIYSLLSEGMTRNAFTINQFDKIVTFPFQKI